MTAEKHQDKIIATDSCDAHLNVTVPKFRKAWTYSNPDKKSTVLTISIAPKDADRDRLIALACKLGKIYSIDQVFVGWILDDYPAAKKFGSTGRYASEASNRSVRASYSFDREENSQRLIWTPDKNKPFSSIEITLGPPPLFLKTNSYRLASCPLAPRTELCDVCFH